MPVDSRPMHSVETAKGSLPAPGKFVTLPETKNTGMTPLSENVRRDAQPGPKKATLLQVVRIVVSGLFMIGRNRDYGSDAPTIGPARLIIVVFIGTALLIAALVLLATFIAR